MTPLDIPLFLRDLMGAYPQGGMHSSSRGVLRRGVGGSHRGFMLTGVVPVAEAGEFRHTDLGRCHFGVI